MLRTLGTSARTLPGAPRGLRALNPPRPHVQASGAGAAHSIVAPREGAGLWRRSAREPCGPEGSEIWTVSGARLAWQHQRDVTGYPRPVGLLVTRAIGLLLLYQGTFESEPLTCKTEEALQSLGSPPRGHAGTHGRACGVAGTHHRCLLPAVSGLWKTGASTDGTISSVQNPAPASSLRETNC